MNSLLIKMGFETANCDKSSIRPVLIRVPKLSVKHGVSKSPFLRWYCECDQVVKCPDKNFFWLSLGLREVILRPVVQMIARQLHWSFSLSALKSGLGLNSVHLCELFSWKIIKFLVWWQSIGSCYCELEAVKNFHLFAK